MKNFLIAFLVVLLIAIMAAVSFAADPTYGPKVYNKQGGDELVVANGGAISVEDGGNISGLSLSITSKVLALTDWVLSAVEKLTTLLTLTSGSTGTNYIIDSPGTAGRVFIIRNASNGSVTIKENGGTGVTIATGKTAVVMHNGTDYVRVTADATH
jgi:hypothetical protein